MGQKFRNWLGRFRKNDAGTARLVCRRFASGRGTAFLEFALVLPLLLAVTTFIIEVCTYWDATVMANHTAFTLARIAKVNVVAGKVAFPSALKIKNTSIMDSEKFTTTMLMMTATSGWFKGTKEWISFPDIKGIIQKLIFKKEGSGGGIFEFLMSAIQGLLDPLLEKLNKFLEDMIQKAFSAIFGQSGGLMANRYLNLYRMAYQRSKMDGVIKTDVISLKGKTIKYPTHIDWEAYWFWKVPRVNEYKNPAIVRVTVNYPVTENWIYAAFMPGASKGKVCATGVAAMLVEPDKFSSSYIATKSGGVPEKIPDFQKNEQAYKEATDKYYEAKKSREDAEAELKKLKSKKEELTEEEKKQQEDLEKKVKDLKQKEDDAYKKAKDLYGKVSGAPGSDKSEKNKSNKKSK